MGTRSSLSPSLTAKLMVSAATKHHARRRKERSTPLVHSSRAVSVSQSRGGGPGLPVNMVLNVHRNHKAHYGRGKGSKEVNMVLNVHRNRTAC